MFVKQCHGIFELLNRIGLKVHHQQDKLRPSYQIQKLRFHIVSIKGRGIHQLDLNVIHRHHPGSRFPGSERKISHLRTRIGQRCHKSRFPHIGRPHYNHLPCSFLVDTERRFPFAQPFFGLGGILQFGNPLSEIRPQLIRALVLGHDGEHLFETGDFFSRRFCLTITLFCLKVIGWKICGHGFRSLLTVDRLYRILNSKYQILSISLACVGLFKRLTL